jgi:hypothetical protein
MNLDNIYEYEEYDKVVFSSLIDKARALNFVYPKFVRTNNNILVACDVANLFKTNFFLFRDCVESNGFYKKNTRGNKLYNRINQSTMVFCSDALRSLDMALSSANVPLAMRIMKSIYDTLVLSTAINTDSLKKKSCLTEKQLSKYATLLSNIHDEDDLFYVNKIRAKLKQNDLNSVPSQFSSFNLSLDWLTPLFSAVGENKIKSIFNKSYEQLVQNISVEDITKILGIFEFDFINQMAVPFYEYSIVDIYMNNKNPAITPLVFDDINELGISYYSKYEESFLLDSLKLLPKLFVTYFKTTSIQNNDLLSWFSKVNTDIVLKPFSNYKRDYYPEGGASKEVQRISFERGNESSYVNIVNDFKQQAKLGSSYYIDNQNYYVNLSECNIDPMFIKVMKGLINIDSDEKKESINKYFSNYKDTYIVSDDAFCVDKNNPRWAKDRHNYCSSSYEGQVNNNFSGDLAYKWQSVFKSLLNGFRFHDIKKLPIEAQCNFFNLKEPKRIFINYNADNKYKMEDELATGQFLISCVQSFTNVCNLILVNDIASALNETKKLYDSIIIKTYIGIKNKQEVKGVVVDQGDLTVFKFLSDAMNYTTINIQLTNDKKELIEGNIFPSKVYNSDEANNFYRMKHPKIIRDMMEEHELFSFTGDDGLNSVDDIASYLSNNIGLDVSVSTFNRLYISNLSKKVPFFSTKEISDNTLSLMILDFASLINRTLQYDIMSNIIDKKSITKVIDVVNYMLKRDLGEIDV